MSNYSDAIDSLLKYVDEIKPYHTKVIEVLTEYVYDEQLNVSISEKSMIDVGIYIDGVLVDVSGSSVSGSYDTGPYDNAQYFPIISLNTTLPLGAFDNQHPEKKAYSANENRIEIAGDQTAIYRVGREVVVELNQHNNITGVDTLISSDTYTIQTSTYTSNGQTNGILDTQHTTLILDGLVDETTHTLQPDHSWSANVKLQPIDVQTVVVNTSTSTNTSRIAYSSIPMLGPPTLDGQQFVPAPASTSAIGDGNVTNYDNYIVIDGDTLESFPFQSTLILLVSGEHHSYTVSTSYLDSAGDTVVHLLEDLDATADYSTAQVVEAFHGYSETYTTPTSASATNADIPEGLMKTAIHETFAVSWNDGTEEVHNLHQFLIRETIANNTIVIAKDGRDLLDYFSIGDTLNIVEHESANNGKHVIVNITPIQNGTEIEVATTLNISTDTGFIETT